MDSKYIKEIIQIAGPPKAERQLARALRKLAAAEHISMHENAPWWSEGPFWRVQKARRSVAFWTKIVGEERAPALRATLASPHRHSGEGRNPRQLQ